MSAWPSTRARGVFAGSSSWTTSASTAPLCPAGWLAVDKVINGNFPLDSCQAHNNRFNDTHLKTSRKF